MSQENPSRIVPLPARLEAVLWGTDDPRLRATWRVLLTWGLLFGWSVIAALAARSTKPLWETAPSPAQQILNISVGTAIFLVLFAGFARYIDRRSLPDYGFTWSPIWVGELGVGFLAVCIGTALWHALGVGLGWTTLELAIDPTDLSSVLWLIALLVPWYFSGLTQSLFSVALVTKNAAEGLDARGAPLVPAATGAVVVAVLFFIFRHSPTSAPRVLSLVFGGAVFILLYVHSGDLALSIGALASGNYTNRFVFRATASGSGEGLYFFELSQSLPDIVEVIAQTNLVPMLLAYVLAVGWLSWQRNGPTIHPSIVRWRPR